MASIALSHTWMGAALLPRLPLWAACAAKHQAERSGLVPVPPLSNGRTNAREPATTGESRLAGRLIPGCSITGFTTPAVQDVGGASVRLRLPTAAGGGGGGSGPRPCPDLSPLDAGGYLLGIRLAGAGPTGASAGWLPAIASVPGDKGADRHGESRQGLAELMVLARPLLAGGTVPTSTPRHVTFLDEPCLRQLYPVGAKVDVAVLERATGFFLGLNAGRWLTIRMSEIASLAADKLSRDAAADAAADAADATSAGAAGAQGQVPLHAPCTIESLLGGTGLECSYAAAPPPPNKEYLFAHMGLSGNGGVSGQQVLGLSEFDRD